MSVPITIHVSHGKSAVVSITYILVTFNFVGPKVEDISLDDPDSTSINDLKILIHEKFGVPVETQKVIFKGQCVV